MRVQFNLLPDVKQQYIKAQQTRRTITLISILASAACIALFLIMLSLVYGVNKLQISNANKDITQYKQELSKIPDLDKVLTVQNQLAALAGLHQSKHITSRIYDYLTEMTPTNAKLGRLEIDMTANSLDIEGTTDSQKTVNTFIDTLKFTTYKIDGKDTGKSAFPSVVESNFGITQQGVGYGIKAQFDPALFANSGNVSLNVPAGITTTRSVLDDPSNILFNGQTGQTNSTDQNGAGGQ